MHRILAITVAVFAFTAVLVAEQPTSISIRVTEAAIDSEDRGEHALHACLVPTALAESTIESIHEVLRDLRIAHLQVGLTRVETELAEFQARLYFCAGDFRKAERAYRDMLASIVRDSPGQRSDVSDTLIKIGLALERSGRDPVGFFRKALEYRTGAVGDDAMALEHLARALRASTDTGDEALRLDELVRKTRARRVSEIGGGRPVSTSKCASTIPSDSQFDAPRLASMLSPVYTDGAWMAGLEGTTILCVTVDPSGQVRSIGLEQGIGLGLDESAARAVREWEFIPARRARRAVASKVLVEVQFNLE